MKKSIYVLCIMLITGSAFANNTNECPAVSFIQKAVFTKVSNFMDTYHWIITTEDYSFQNKLWHTNFYFAGVYENREQALKAGQKYFGANVKLSQPRVTEDNGERTCIYQQGSDLAVYAKNLTVN